MDRIRWPSSIRTLRGYLPTDMRVLRGAVGAFSGVILFVSIISILLSGNWQLGYGDDRILVAIFLVLIPAGLGVASPIWYWLGRPVWGWFDRPGNTLLRPLQEVRFLPGLVGSVIGVTLLFPVHATSRLFVQSLAPFGLAIAVGTPLWYWILRPTGVVDTERWLPEIPSGSPLTTTAARSLLVLGVLFGASLAITTVIALPIVGIGQPVTEDRVAIAITDAQTVTGISGIGNGAGYGSDSGQFLLIRVSVENQAETRRPLPGASVGDITVIAPTCRVQNFGEPSHNCNQVYVDGNFSANGTTYRNYDSRHASADGTIGPGDRITGWLVYRLESRPTQPNGFESMVIIDDVGRWALSDAD